MVQIRFALLIAFMLVGATADAAEDTALAWAALRGDGHVALIRHAPAPGAVGDPSDYKLDDCTTQRNLSEQGRAEAAALGAPFRMQQVKVGKIVSFPVVPLHADRRIDEHRSGRKRAHFQQCLRIEHHARRTDRWCADYDRSVARTRHAGGGHPR